MIECKIYSAVLPEKTCALRYKHANNQRSFGSYPGATDPNCKVCEVGRRLFEEGWHKERRRRTENGGRRTEDRRRRAEDRRRKVEGKKVDKENRVLGGAGPVLHVKSEKVKGDEMGGSRDILIEAPEGLRVRDKLLIDEKTGKAWGRVCNMCGTPKPWDEFVVDKKGPCGRKGSCKLCQAEAKRRWYEKKQAARADTQVRPYGGSVKEGGGRKTEDRGRKTEDRGRKVEDRAPAENQGRQYQGVVEEFVSPAVVCEPDRADVIKAIEAGAYRAVVDMLAGIFEGVANNIRSAGKEKRE